MNFDDLAALLDRAYSDGYLDREQALRDFGAEHHASIAVYLAARLDLAELLREASIGAPDHWAVFVLEGALAADDHGDVAQEWLDNPNRSSETCVAIAARCALRVLPLLNHWHVADQPESRSAVLLPTFWGTCAAWLCSAWPTVLGDVGHANLRPRLRQRPDVEPAMAAAHVADFVIDYVFSGVSDEDIPAVAHEALLSAQSAVHRLAPALGEPFRSAFAHDAVAATRSTLHSESPHLSDLAVSPLWPGGTPDLIAENWRPLATRLEHLNQDWHVWTQWYDGRLNGSNAHRDVELDRVAIAEDFALDDSADVNRAVRDRIDQHVAARFPDRQPLAIDATNRFALARVDVTDDRAFDRVCDQLLDTLKPFADARFSNLYADLNDPVQLLSGTLETRRDAPLIVHRRVDQVVREVERLARRDKTLSDDFNVRTLMEDLTDAAATIPLAVPAVAEEIAKRATSRLAGLPTDDREAIKEAAGLLADNADEPVRELVEEAIDALDTSESATQLSEPDSQRVYTLGWMMAKLPALKTAMAGLKLIADLQAVFTAVAKVYHFILRLFL